MSKVAPNSDLATLSFGVPKLWIKLLDEVALELQEEKGGLPISRSEVVRDLVFARIKHLLPKQQQQQKEES
jgi:hypothetical protein